MIVGVEGGVKVWEFKEEEGEEEEGDSRWGGVLNRMR